MSNTFENTNTPITSSALGTKESLVQEPSSDSSTQATYVSQAQGIAASAVSAAQPYVDAGLQKAQSLAAAAQVKGNEAAAQTEKASNELEIQLSAKTDAAVAEGQHDVAQPHVHVQSQGSKYVDQAIGLAGVALGTVQGIIHAGQEKLVGHPATRGPDEAPHPHGFLENLLNTAGAVVANAQAGLHPHVVNAQAAVQPHVDTAKATAQPYVASAQNTLANAHSVAQPHIDAVVNAAQPHIDAAKDLARPHVDNAKSIAQPYVESAQKSLASVTPSKTVAETDPSVTDHTIGAAQQSIQPHLDATAPQPHIASATERLEERLDTDSTLGNGLPADRDQAHIDEAKKSLGL